VARLKDFGDFIRRQAGVLRQAEQHLLQRQARYEQFFAEVARVREEELDQLQVLVAERRAELPGWLGEALDELGPVVEAELEARITELAEAEATLLEKAEATRQESLAAELELHGANVGLDASEEKLKARAQELLEGIDRYNARIRTLGSGLGFFMDVFRMHRLRQERRALEEEQQEVMERVDHLRLKWEGLDEEHTTLQSRRRTGWVDHRARASELRAQQAWLEAGRERLAWRTVLERAMRRSRPEGSGAGRRGGACPRCGFDRRQDGHLCRVCGARLGPDRPDLAGSLEEIAEALEHHASFAEGMKAAQELIGLVRGLISGHEAFEKSVEDMVLTEVAHPVPNLKISVPRSSEGYASHFARLSKLCSPGEPLHPLEFVARVKTAMSGELTEGKIQDYFETMGEELSRQAERQWA